MKIYVDTKELIEIYHEGILVLEIVIMDSKWDGYEILQHSPTKSPIASGGDIPQQLIDLKKKV